VDECTFTPRTKWNLIEERRNQATLSPALSSTPHEGHVVSRSERERMERDRKYEEPELKECTFFPETNWKTKSGERNVSGISNHGTEYDDTFEKLMDHGEQSSRPEMLPSSDAARHNVKLESATEFQVETRPETPPSCDAVHHNVKLVSAEEFQEESGKNSNPPAIVRQNMVRQIISPKSPEWKKKYRIIGQKADKESNVEAGGRGAVDSRKRGHTVIRSPGLDASKGSTEASAKSNPSKNLDVQLELTATTLEEDVTAAEKYDGHVSLTDVSKGEVTIEQQKLLAEQAMEIRLAQKQRAQEIPMAERKQKEASASNRCRHDYFKYFVKQQRASSRNKVEGKKMV
jgi:hypothetical protein